VVLFRPPGLQRPTPWKLCPASIVFAGRTTAERVNSITTAIQTTVILVAVAGAMTWLDFSFLSRPEAVDGTGSIRRRWLGVRYAWLGLAASIALFCSVWVAIPQFIPIFILAAMTIYIARTMSFGLEGSDEMALVVLVPLALAILPGAPESFRRLALLFVAGQLLLAYLASAGAKVAGTKWRQGTAVAQILSTRDYGIEKRELFDSRVPAFFLFSWGTMAFEFLLPIGFVLGGPFLILAVVSGVLFHLSIAAVMGLNRFFPWFLAAYPAAIWASLHYGLIAH
jgi:hypothetical protein